MPKTYRRKTWHLVAIWGALLLVGLTARGTDPRDPAALGPEVTALSISAPPGPLMVGGTRQLTVLATFADGSTREVTSDSRTVIQAFPGEAVAIGATGVVTGISSADVVVVVDHQTYTSSKSASLTLIIRTADDRDGDGLSDAVEIAHQLNPDFAGDAGADLDQDGLTSAQEIALGTDLRKADSDDDYDPDGLEVAQGTDPLVSDLPSPPPLPSSDLDESCVVSVLNRSARVEPSGVWVLPNVPSTSGRVRARATCVENGFSRSGQSDFFFIPTNGVIRIADIRFDAPQQIPVRLDLVAPSDDLTTAGQTVQLLALATYPGGVQADLTAAVKGTGYRSSNLAIAAVSGEGLLSAQASGTAIVSALNEGALGVLEIRVALSGDSDGDGLPDDFEIANGLDPNNPLDVLDDLDNDGLTNGEEFQRGTGLRIPDTDGDDLRDGDEVNRYRTDPLLFDTDGDGIGDGLEVQSGSDPLDPASFNLAPILAALSAAPAPLDLVFDTVVGEASQRLTVSGRLIDGRTIDLRLRSRGTHYTSSDLAIASFGAEDGRVFAGEIGNATITVSNGGKTATVATRVTTFIPGIQGFLPIPGFPNGVGVANDFAYIAAGTTGLVVVDVANLSSPQIIGGLDTAGNANDIRVAADRAYLADGTNGLLIVDISNPALPALLGRADTPGIATDVAVAGDFAYVADGTAGLAVIDVTDPAAPVLLGQVDTPGNARGVDVAASGLVIVADGGGGVLVIDVADPAAPVLRGRTATRSDGLSHAADVRVRGTLVYVADGADATLGGLKIVDFSVPTTPVVVGASSDAFGLSGVAVEDEFVATSDFYFANGVPLFNAADSRRPVFTAALDFSRFVPRRDDNGNGVAVSNGAVFMVGVIGWIADNGTVGNGALFIGRYRSARDILGIAPEVAITTPATGFSAGERTTFTVEATAVDDARVSSVTFMVDGVAVATDFARPYTARATAPAGALSLTLTAVASDLGGNEGTSEPVVVAVIPDQAPTVELLEPSAGSRSVEGTTIALSAYASDDDRVTAVRIRVDGIDRGTLAVPPYRIAVPVAVGATSLTIEAIATDNVGQTATTGVFSFPVVDDPLPVAVVLQPNDGFTIVEGGRLKVRIGATDDLGVGRVDLLIAGIESGARFTPPYDFNVDVPLGATEMLLSARATDSLGQVGQAPEVTVAVGPDQRTTAEGRALDPSGDPASGAAVDCLGESGTTGVDGTFSIPSVRTALDEVSCSVSVNAGGEDRGGRSAPQPPIPGGITPVGDIVVSAKLLYAVTGDPAGHSGFGRLYAYDHGRDRLVPQSEPFEPTGLRAIAFSLSGELYALRNEGPILKFQGGATRGKAIGTGSRSELLRLDPDTGELLGPVGPIVDEVSDELPFEVGLDDLAWSPTNGKLYGLDVGRFGDSRRIYQIGPASGIATPLGGMFVFATAGLAAGPDGLLYVFGEGLEAAGAGLASKGVLASHRLVVFDPVSATPVTDTDIGGFVGRVESVAFRPGRGSLLVASGNEILELDLASLTVAPFSAPNGLDSQLTGLAFRPIVGAGQPTTLIGRVVDEEGQPVAGASVETLGAETTSGADGTFSIPNLAVPNGRVRVAVRTSDLVTLSAALEPVVGGITDFGDLAVPLD